MLICRYLVRSPSTLVRFSCWDLFCSSCSIFHTTSTLSNIFELYDELQESLRPSGPAIRKESRKILPPWAAKSLEKGSKSLEKVSKISARHFFQTFMISGLVCRRDSCSSSGCSQSNFLSVSPGSPDSSADAKGAGRERDR